MSRYVPPRNHERRRTIVKFLRESPEGMAMAREIADFVDISQSNAVVLLRYMEDEELVTREKARCGCVFFRATELRARA